MLLDYSAQISLRSVSLASSPRAMGSPRRRATLSLAPKAVTVKRVLLAGGRKNASHTLFLFLFSAFFFLIFFYNDEIKSLADYSFATAARSKYQKDLAGESRSTPAAGISSAVADPVPERTQIPPSGSRPQAKVEANGRPAAAAQDECELAVGRWVFDDVSYPLYKEHECQFLTEQVTCIRNGRRDDSYQKWRWQPRDCEMPRYQSTSSSP